MIYTQRRFLKIHRIFLQTIILFFLVLAGADKNAADNRLQAGAVIQVSSIISDGKYSLQEIVEIAGKDGVAVVIFTDRDFMNWEYGLWPFRKIIKKKVEAGSLSSYGTERYFKEIEDIQKKNPDIVLISGVETAPFYYWEGSPFKNNLKIVDWHKHLLVFGLDKLEDYRNLPSVSNKNGLLLPYGFKDIYRLWPLLFLVIGILCLKKREFDYKDFRGNPLSPYSRPWQVFGGVCLIIGLIYSVNDYPFRGLKYDQYHGAQGIGPYQDLIDYVNRKGGMAFWAHPEIDNIIQYDKVKAETKKHPENLLESRNYTGFTIFYEGDKTIGTPGGIWDKVLKEYCGGLRSGPVWAIGGLGFDQNGDFDNAVKDLRTVFLVLKIDKEAVLTALRKGKMYVVRGMDCKKFILDKFMIKDSLSDVNGTIADEITLKGKPVINIKGRITDGKNTEKVTVKLIKDGFIIKIFDAGNPFDISYIDGSAARDKKSYYRLEINAPGRILVTNPVFIKLKT